MHQVWRFGRHCLPPELTTYACSTCYWFSVSNGIAMHTRVPCGWLGSIVRRLSRRSARWRMRPAARAWLVSDCELFFASPADISRICINTLFHADDRQCYWKKSSGAHKRLIVFSETRARDGQMDGRANITQLIEAHRVLSIAAKAMRHVVA